MGRLLLLLLVLVLLLLLLLLVLVLVLLLVLLLLLVLVLVLLLLLVLVLLVVAGLEGRGLPLGPLASDAPTGPTRPSHVLGPSAGPAPAAVAAVFPFLLLHRVRPAPRRRLSHPWPLLPLLPLALSLVAPRHTAPTNRRHVHDPPGHIPLPLNGHTGVEARVAEQHRTSGAQALVREAAAEAQRVVRKLLGDDGAAHVLHQRVGQHVAVENLQGGGQGQQERG